MKYLPPRFLLRRFEVLRALSPGQSFLEVGAGDLTLTMDLLKRFDSGVAVELTDDLLDIHAALPEDTRSRLSVHSADFMTIQLDERFDAFISCEVLEHVEHDEEFLRKAFESLTPGGQLIIAVPSRMKYWTVHDEIVGHLRRYERAELRSLLTAVGFSDIEIRSYGFPWVNLLRIPRLLLARHQTAERTSWDLETKTTESNHRQIPESLARSPLRFITRPAVFDQLARLSRPFNRFDLSDGYVVVGRRR